MSAWPSPGHGDAASGMYPVHVTLSDASGAVVAEADAMIEIAADGTTTIPSDGGLPGIGCQATRSSGLGVVLALGLVLRRRRRR